MQLIDIRTEVLACGFDANLFGASRINAYINNGYLNTVRRVQYYVDEAIFDFNTVAGTASFALPADFAKIRSLRRTDLGRELEAVGLRDIDRSVITQGTPYAYAQDGANLHLYPTPDQVYPLELRYWNIPAALAADSDVPKIPADYHNMLVYWACAEGYRAEDDHAPAQQWQALYDKSLAELSADLKFDNSDMSTQVKGMWESGRGLSQRGWSIIGSDWGP